MMDTADIVELRRAGLTWGQIAIRAGLSRAAVRERYVKATGLDERARRKHAEAYVMRVQAQLEAADLLAEHAKKWAVHDGAVAYALMVYEEVRNDKGN